MRAALMPGRGHDGVEAGSELGVPVTDEEAELTSVVLQLSHEVAGHLHRPGAVGVGGHTEEVDDAAFDLDHEQSVVPAEQGGVNGEEVGSQDAQGLGVRTVASSGLASVELEGGHGGGALMRRYPLTRRCPAS